MASRPKGEKGRVMEGKKESTCKPKTYLKTESTFLNSNNASLVKMESEKAAKVVYKMERNLHDLKKAWNIPPNPPVSHPAKEMTVSELQSYYLLMKGEHTDDFQKLYRLYREYLLPNGSSSSSNGSESCRTNKRRTVQDIRISQPSSPYQNRGLVMKSRRGSEASKGTRKDNKESKEKSRIKTQLSTKNLTKGSQLLDPTKNDPMTKQGMKDQSRQRSSGKKKIKSILKKPSFENVGSVTKGVRGSIPALFSKLYENKSIEKHSNSRSKQPIRSPRCNQILNQKKPKKESKLYLTSRSKDEPNKSNEYKPQKSKKDLSKYKLMPQKGKLKLDQLLDEINQLSPISNSPYARGKR